MRQIITKLTLILTYTNCQLVNRETGHKSMMANQ